MRIYFDTEFMEDGSTIELLSLGAVSEDGREFYGVNLSADHKHANPWVKEHVLPHVHMDVKGPLLYRVSASHPTIATEFRAWAEQGLAPEDRLEFWGYYADYDWVVLCQLFGRMVDLPANWPKYAYDLRQWLDENGFEAARQPDESIHHALLDARWIAESHQGFEEGLRIAAAARAR